MGAVMMSPVEIEPNIRCRVLVKWIDGGKRYWGEHPRNVVTSTGPGNKFKVRSFPESDYDENIPALYLLTV